MYKHNFKILILLLLLLITNEAKPSASCQTCDMQYKNYYKTQPYQPSSKCSYKRKENLRGSSSNTLNASLLLWGIGLVAGIAAAVITVPQNK